MELLVAFVVLNVIVGIRSRGGRRLPPAALLGGAVGVLAIAYTGQRFL